LSYHKIADKAAKEAFFAILLQQAGQNTLKMFGKIKYLCPRN
jgi:hypothetical protein